LNDSLTIGLI